MPVYRCDHCPPAPQNGAPDGISEATQYGDSDPEEGDIYSMEQSVMEPIYRILTGKALPEKRTTGSSTSLPAGATSLASVKSTTSEGRPCIINRVSAKQGGQNTAIIYVMATYEGKSIDTMPYVFQHFSVGVSPNLRCPTGHIHTKPEWKGSPNQWVIVFPYSVPLEKLVNVARWSTSRATDKSGNAPESHHRVDEYMRTYLRLLNTRKVAEWEKQCQKDNGLVARMCAECSVQLPVGSRARLPRAQAGSARSQSSSGRQLQGGRSSSNLSRGNGDGSYPETTQSKNDGRFGNPSRTSLQTHGSGSANAPIDEEGFRSVVRKLRTRWQNKYSKHPKDHPKT